MKITLKTLQSQTCTIEFNDENSVKDFKEAITAIDDLKGKYDPALLKLIYKGEVMDDEDSVAHYCIADDGFVLLVRQAPGKPKLPPKKKPNQAFPYGVGGFNSTLGMGPMSSTFMQSPFSHDPLMSSSLQPNPMMLPALRPNSMLSASTSLQSNCFNPQQKMFSDLQSSPYDTGSLHSASYTPATTTSFLMNPIQSSNPNPIPANVPSTSEREVALLSLTQMGFDKENAEKALRASSYSVEVAVEYLTSGIIPDVYEQPSIIPPSLPQPAVPISVSPDSSSSNAAQGGSMNLAQMYEMVQKNPGHLQQIKAALIDEQPEIAKMIDDDPTGFLDLLKAAAAAAAAQTNNPDHTASPVVLSFQEQQSIKQIEEMGFDRNRAIEAFLTCDRNQEQAIHYLLNAAD